jgi:hypothetical protein
MNNGTFYKNFLDKLFPGMKSSKDLLSLIPVMLSNNPDATILARGVIN